MGNSEAKPSSLSGHAGAPPPSLMYPMGNSGAKPSSSGAASPSPMNPMGTSAGARPRASPTAPSTISSDAPCSTNNASSGTGETMKPEYPRRPGMADCSYYLKFGTCGYGMKCWFNHPDLHSTGGGQSQASNPSEHNNKQYFSGKACNPNRHGGKNKVEHVKMNFLGLPLRAGAGLCSYYMHRGTCKFGTNCKFDHPDPKSEHANSNSSSHVVQESSQLKFSSEPIQRENNEQYVPLVSSPTSGRSKIIPIQRESTCTEHCAYKYENSRFQSAKKIHYTRDQLLEIREIVGVPKDILELNRDIDAELVCARASLNLRTSKLRLFLEEEGCPLPQLLEEEMASLVELGVGTGATIIVDEES